MIELDELPAEAPSPLASDECFFVYEVWNYALRVLVIGVGEQPERLSHWKAEPAVSVKIVESLLSRQDAVLFAKLYGERCAAADLRVYLEID